MKETLSIEMFVLKDGGFLSSSRGKFERIRYFAHFVWILKSINLFKVYHFDGAHISVSQPGPATS